MAVISQDLKDIFEDKETLKVVATTDRDGVPHVVYKGSLHIEDDKFVFYDLLQSSTTNKNLVNAIWFDKKVAINILSKDKRSFHIVGRPEKSITAGKGFEEVYNKIQSEHDRSFDLNAIWYIIPEEINEVSYTVRRQEQQEKFPILGHLDQFTRR